MKSQTIKSDITEFRSSFWKIDYPSKYVVKKQGGVVSIVAEDGVGSLDISGYVKDTDVHLDDLKSLAKDCVPQNAEVRGAAVGNLSGLATEVVIQGRFWRMWVVSKERLMLYITYNCLVEDRNVETDSINLLISSIEWRPD